MKAEQLLAEAKRLVVGETSAEAGLRCRAAVLLSRQALEARVIEILATRAPHIEDAAFDAQLLSLLGVMQNAELAKRARYVWAALSSASHMQQYDLPPTSIELTDWIETVDLFLCQE